MVPLSLPPPMLRRLVEKNVADVLSFEPVCPPNPTVIEGGQTVVSQTPNPSRRFSTTLSLHGSRSPDHRTGCSKNPSGTHRAGSTNSRPHRCRAPSRGFHFPFLLPKIRCQYSYCVHYLWLMSKVHHSSVSLTAGMFKLDMKSPHPEHLDEEELRRKIPRGASGTFGLEEVKARARAEARAAAQLEVQEQVKQTLEAERADYEEKLKKSILTERVKSEDQRLIAQLYVSTDKWMELKRSQFYKITAESFQKGKEETHSRFARFSVNAACGDLQSRVMNCYGDNPGRTLACSSIARCLHAVCGRRQDAVG
ncbi:hypothetical protein CRUP_021815 [Coryphaenoides rupestris]|nr:hypothetical protein CRUP_021815 [Coryphaenoides rupestris]